MFTEAQKKGGMSTFNGYILLDEMSIQQDLQIMKHGRSWSIVGVVDLGCTVNSLDEISNEKQKLQVGNTLFSVHVCWFQWLQMACCVFWLR